MHIGYMTVMSLLIDDIQKHVTNAHVGTMSIQIPVEALILSPLHAPWLLVMQEWVLHQVVQLCIQDCHTPKREILSVYDRKVLRYLMSKLNPVSSFVFMVLMNIRMAIVMMIS